MRVTRWLILGTGLLLGAPASAQGPSSAPAPPTATVQELAVSEIDAAAFERYQILLFVNRTLLEAQQARQDKAALEEWVKLDRRFRERYNLSVDRVRRNGDKWVVIPELKKGE